MLNVCSKYRNYSIFHWLHIHGNMGYIVLVYFLILLCLQPVAKDFFQKDKKPIQGS